MKTIQKMVCGGLVLAVAAASVPSVHAGDREWATAGKVLTGVAVVGALNNLFAPRTEVVYTSYPQPVVYQQVVTQPACIQRVVTQQGPTQTIVVPAQPTVVYVPVVYQPAPTLVYAAPAPRFVVGVHYSLQGGHMRSHRR